MDKKELYKDIVTVAGTLGDLLNAFHPFGVTPGILTAVGVLGRAVLNLLLPGADSQ